MNIKMYVPKEVSLNIGDRVEFSYTEAPRKNGYTIRRLVETSHGVYAVFNNCTWRPLSTYGITWRKVVSDD